MIKRECHAFTSMHKLKATYLPEINHADFKNCIHIEKQNE